MLAVPSSEAAAAAAAAQPPPSNSKKDPHYGSLALSSSSFEEEEDAFPSQSQQPQPQLLVLWQGIALLTADCLGVGVLALPNDIAVLGMAMGLGFLILNFPINFVAGDYLSQIALVLETLRIPNTTTRRRRRQPQLVDHSDDDDEDEDDDENSDHHENDPDHDDDDLVELVTLEAPIVPLPLTARDESSTDTTNPTTTIHHRRQTHHIHNNNNTSSVMESFQDEPDHNDHDPQPPRIPHDQHHPHHHPDTTTAATHDLIGISTAIFHSPRATSLVMGVYYCNLFLVLGDYILVMGRAMSAMTLDTLCLPVAGGIASILMFGICQFRTMALLGRKVSLASLLAMWIVLLQCLFHHRTTTTTNQNTNDSQAEAAEATASIWTKFSALAGIGFAVGSQKLFLNIRHELAIKEEASKVLAGSLTTYGLVYVAVVLLAGPNPPSFLFDAIPEGWSRQVAGFLLWGHVAVSYAINSQALCSSMDRFLLAASGRGGGWHTLSDAKRWFWLTLTVVISSYLVSNAVPFFKDLVALIGALTSVPLTLTLPALLYRKFHRMRLYLPVWKQQQQQQGGGEPSSSRRVSCGSFPLLVYSIVFLGVGLAGALSSIDEDWLNQGRPFACR